MRKHRGNRSPRPWMVPSWVVILIRWGMGEYLHSFFRGILAFLRSCFGRQRQRRRSSSSSTSSSMQNVIHNQPSGCGIGCISMQGCCNRTKVRGGGDDDDNDDDNACCCGCGNCHDRRSAICSYPWKTNHSIGNKSFSTSSSGVYPMEGDWIIHERQALQLCAVHTINNLLQLVSEQQDQVLQKEENKPLNWICGPIVIETNTMTTSTKLTLANTTTFDTQISQPSSSLSCASKLSKNDSYPTTSIQIPWKSLPKVASQEELDDIATELMMIENSLLDDYSSLWTDDAVGSNSWLSRIQYSFSMFRNRWLGCCHRWHNTHKTMYYGNYSMETLEVALQRRHIQLEWFAPTITSNHHDDAFNPSYLWEVPSGIVVGFIVNQLLDGEWDVADDNYVNLGEDDAREDETTYPETARRNKDADGNGLDIAGYDERGEVYYPSRKEKKNPCRYISRLSTWLYSQLIRALFHRIFGCDDPGRHWYAITRVRRTFHDESLPNKSKKIHDHPCHDDRWKIIDSDRTDQAPRLRPNQLHSHLYRLSEQHNATIFRAILTFPEDHVDKNDIP
jgi:Josephin